ncbi:hypothetical protein [Acetobacter cerevisiae]|uniref:hypothetical protein n=1 Tax=Acetobacter cerevisiae TaxID=178900 RepID=UPI000AD4FC02|nr:hypothetical protein [Acetobacter cerevisiae]
MPDNQIDSSYFSFQTFFRIALSGAILLALRAFIPLFIGYYIQHEDPAYLWDWGGYFNMYQNFGNMIRHKEPWFSTLLTSIRNDDYNLFPISFLAPFSLVFQSSRFGYVCGISLCYLIPTAFISAFSLLSMMSYDKKHFRFPVTGTSFLCVFAFFLTFYPFWAPTLRGLPDIAGLIPLGLATLLLMRSHFLTTASWKTLVAFSVLVWLPFALRRWYAFSILAMLAVACILAVLSAFQSENRKKESIIPHCKSIWPVWNSGGHFTDYFSEPPCFQNFAYIIPRSLRWVSYCLFNATPASLYNNGTVLHGPVLVRRFSGHQKQKYPHLVLCKYSHPHFSAFFTYTSSRHPTCFAYFFLGCTRWRLSGSMPFPHSLGHWALSADSNTPGLRSPCVSHRVRAPG